MAGTCNQGASTPTASTLCTPAGVAVDAAGNLYVSDQSNHRVVRFTDPLTDSTADTVVGQLSLTGNLANLVDARGLSTPSRVAIDRSVTPNRIYVADTDNHRVLGWNNAAAFANGAPADRLLGQPNPTSTGCNTGGVGPGTLCVPRGLAVDSAGNLYVADANNHRVLVFDTPFTSDAVADQVWGQPNFTGTTCNNGGAGPAALCNPWGVALDAAGNLYVADADNDRVLGFTGGRTGDTSADQILGQPNPTTITCNTGGLSAQTLCSPRGMAFDAAGNIYVADYSNSRVLVYTAATGDAIADRVLGQANMTTGTCNTPGVTNASLCNPGTVAVDSAGNVWVGDEGNSRVLGYLTPLTTNTQADRVLGKGSTTSTACSPATGSCIVTSAPAVALDAANNVYVADPNGNRVLGFNTPFATGSDSAADRVLGQSDVFNTARNSVDSVGLNGPAHLHVDRNASPNRLFVADAQNHRVVVWNLGTFTNGQPADRVVGQTSLTGGVCNAGGIGPGTLCTPIDITTDTAGNLYISDNGSRVLQYDTPFATGGDLVADRVFGQKVFTSVGCNSGGISALSLCAARGLTVAPSGQVYVADSNNHRLLRYEAPLATDLAADAVLGQVGMRFNGQNLVESAGLSSPYAVAIDTSVTPNRVYVADTGNSRVLAWADVTGFQTGAPADLVLGQPDLLTPGCNSQGISASSLCSPNAVAVDAQGRVYVSDNGNHRLLLFQPPFSTDTVADAVIGQADFTGNVCNRGSTPANNTLCTPYGVVVSPATDLFISDRDNDRILVFTDPWTTDLLADRVFGQGDVFTTGNCNKNGRSENSLCEPHQIALDTSLPAMRLYVADATNHRVLEYDAPLTSDTTADMVIGQTSMSAFVCAVGQTSLCDPQGVAVDSQGNLFVGDNDNDRVLQFNTPRTTDGSADRLFGQPNLTSTTCNAGGVSASSQCSTRGVTLDAVGSLYVADTNNHRIAIYLANNRPTASPLTLSPAAPTTTDNLVGTYSYQDTDGDAQSGTEVRWYKNGQEQAAFSGLLTVPASATTRDEQWHFTVRPRDGLEHGRLETSPVVTILNSAPVATAPTLTPSPPRTDDVLTANYSYTDADQDSQSGSEVRWFLNNVEQPSLFNQLTVPASATTKGQVWQFTVRPGDGTSLGALVSSPVVTIANSAPSAANVQINPASPSSNASLNVSYAYADPDADAELGSEIRWYRNNVLQPGLNDLRTVPPQLTLNDVWYYTLRPRDGADLGALVRSTSVVVGSSAPTATNVRIDPNPARTDNILRAEYTYADPDSQVETNSQIRWFKNNAAQTVYNNTKQVPASATTKGESWHFTVTPCDSTAVCGLMQTAPAVVIANTAPVASTPAISPASPRANEVLTANYTYADADGDAQNNSEIRWFKNGTDQPTLAGQRNVPVGNTAKGQSWYFTVRPRDGADLGALITSPTVIIANTAPAATALTLLPVDPRVNDTLVASYTYSDADSDAQNGTVVSWFRNGTEDTSLRNALIVPPAKLAKGQMWRFTVTPRDGTANGTVATSPTVAILNTAPVAGNLSISPGTPNAGDALSASYSYADADGDAQSGSEIRWFKNGQEQAALLGALSVPVGVTAKGERWSFSVRPRDGADFGTPLTSVEVSIANNAPLASSLSIQPSQPGTEDNLVANYTYLDSDGDIEAGTELRWFKNGVEAQAFSGLKTLPASATAKGESWYVTVRPRDGTDFGQLITSAPVIILNTPPRATNVNLSPLSPKATDPMVASYSYSDADGDAQQGTELRWFKNGVEVVSLAGQITVPANTAKSGETWYFTVLPKDGVAFGGLVTSTSVIVESSAPVATALQITPFSPTTFDPLVANYLYSDPDGAPEVGSEIEWYRNNVLVPSLTGMKTVPAGTAHKGEAWSFSVRPNDGTSFGARQTSAPVTIGNTTPSASAATISPEQPRTEDALQAVFTYTDVDGDAQAGSEIRWYRNGLEQASLLNQNVVPASATAKREVWYYRVRPRDGTDYGTAEVSSPVFIGNTPPVAHAGVDQRIVPTQRVMRVTLDGSGTRDADGDLLDYTWSEGGVDLGRGIRATVDLPVGPHTLTLTVRDGEAFTTDEVLIDIPDPKPAATAPADFTVPPGRVTLTGSATDSLGRTPAYQWTQVSGAPVELLDADKPTARFLGTAAGTYTFELVATSDTSPSDPVRTTVTILDLPPWASAPARRVVQVGQEVALDGSDSSDPNGDALSWRWTLELGASTATLSDEALPTARLTPTADGRYGVTLVVNDGSQNSAPVLTEVIAIDPQVTSHAPVAHAGPDSVGELGKPIALEGRGSFDVDGDVLTYAWRKVSGPADAPVPATSPTPTFRATGAGTVVLGLTVSDGKVTSPEDLVTFEIDNPAANSRPIARAGLDRSAVLGTEVQLDGTRSADPDGDVLTYRWTQLAGPRVTLDDDRSARPAFTPTRAGFLRFGLTVSDGKLTSVASSVLVQVTTGNNSPPLANAGADQQVIIGDPVTLDGSGSSDPNGDTLRYVWEQIWGSPVVLGSQGDRPAFQPPGKGLYRFRLTVWDGEVPSAADEVDVVVSTHGANNQTPVARAGTDLEVKVGEKVVLDGSGSQDPDPLDKLSYEWTLAGFPTGNEPALTDATTVTPSFTPTVPGAYTARLRVSDGDLASAPSYVTVRVVSGDEGGFLGCGSGPGAPLPLAALLWLLGSKGRRARVTRGARALAARVLAIVLSLGLAGVPSIASAAAEKTQLKPVKKPVKKPVTKTATKPVTTKPVTKPVAKKPVKGWKKKKKSTEEFPVEEPLENLASEPTAPTEEFTPEPAPVLPTEVAAEPVVTPDTPVMPQPSVAPPAAPATQNAVAEEGPPNPYLEEARQLYLSFQFEGLIPKLEFALAVKGVTPAQRIEIYKLMALTHAAFDDAAQAEDAFLRILELKPDYELTGGASPKIRAYFGGAQKTYRARQAVKLQHAPPKPSAHGETTTVDVTVSAGTDRVAAMTLHYRPRGSTSGFSQLSMVRGENGAFSSNVPNAFPGPAGKRTLDYFVRARDTSGALLASVGSEEVPLELTIETVELVSSQPLYKNWWFWTAVGVGAAAAVATPVLINRSAQVRPGTLGMEPLK
ncbi:MAG TPA: PKD domain-containing protein [Myxococcaceae bacterium]